MGGGMDNDNRDDIYAASQARTQAREKKAARVRMLCAAVEAAVAKVRIHETGLGTANVELAAAQRKLDEELEK